MQHEARDVSYLWDMLQASRDALDFTRGVTLETFLQDRKLQRAVERAVEIVGEAAARVSAELREAHPEIPWRKIIAQRNVLAHEYGDVERRWCGNSSPTICQPSLSRSNRCFRLPL